MSLDDISTKLDDLAASIGALQKEPCEPVVPKVNIQVKGLHFKTEEEFREKVILLYKGLGSITKNRKMPISRNYTIKGNFPIGRCFRLFIRKLAPFQMIINMCQTL